MLRPEWRLWPLSSFLGLIDLKTGVTIALLFALLNKVAGVYGLIAVLTGAGGSFAQLSLYIYSVIALVALAWGLRAVKDVCLPSASPFSPISYLLIFTGGSQADTIFRAPFRRRPRPFHSMDSVFCSRLVDMDTSRWQASGELGGTGGYDEICQHHKSSH